MKKTYIRPNVKAIKVSPIQMIAISIPKGTDKIEDSSDYDFLGRNVESHKNNDLWNQEW